MDKLYLACESGTSYSTTTAVTMATYGTITTLLNSIQMWFMRSRVEKQLVGPLSPFLYSLALTDTITGVSAIVVCIGRLVAVHVTQADLVCFVLADVVEVCVLSFSRIDHSFQRYQNCIDT